MPSNKVNGRAVHGVCVCVCVFVGLEVGAHLSTGCIRVLPPLVCSSDYSWGTWRHLPLAVRMDASKYFASRVQLSMSFTLEVWVPKLKGPHLSQNEAVLRHIGALMNDSSSWHHSFIYSTDISWASLWDTQGNEWVPIKSYRKMIPCLSLPGEVGPKHIRV